MRPREPVASTVLYHLFKWPVVSPLLHTYFRIQIHGAEHVPQKGPLVIVSNHASYADPPILSNCVRRPVAFMAKEELFRIPVFKQAIQLYGAYPVKRRVSDRNAIRAALAALNSGWTVGIFLQGTRTRDARITAPKLGAALIAVQAQAPLVPVSLWGTQAIFRKGSALPRAVPITVRMGKPVEPPRSTKREALEQVTHHCTTVINAFNALGR